jgi:hypothetical protein
LCLLLERNPVPQVLPDLSLFNITLTPTLRSEIVAAKRRDKSMMQEKNARG